MSQTCLLTLSHNKPGLTVQLAIVMGVSFLTNADCQHMFYWKINERTKSLEQNQQSSVVTHTTTVIDVVFQDTNVTPR